MLEALNRGISIGPFSLPLFIFPLLLSWLIYNLISGRFYRDNKELLKQINNILLNLIIIFVLVWKLSPLIFSFSSVISNPAAVLYLPGGYAGAAAGLCSAAAYLTFKLLRSGPRRGRLLKGLGINLGFYLLPALVLSIAAAGLTLIEKNPVHSPVPVPGDKAPAFELDSAVGKVYSSSDYTGKVLVLNFWASWCPPCRAELPELISFYEKQDPDEVVFLSINLYSTETDPSSIQSFIAEEGINYPVLYDRYGTAAAAYAVTSVPATVVINGSGNISAVKTGAVTESMLERIVAGVLRPR